MKQYVVDELRPEDHDKIKGYLDEHFGPAGFGGIYWVPLDEDLYTDMHKTHTQCQPYYFAIDLGPDAMACELLIRTKNTIKCNCIGYATAEQRNRIITFVDSILEGLGLIT